MTQRDMKNLEILRELIKVHKLIETSLWRIGAKTHTATINGKKRVFKIDEQHLLTEEISWLFGDDIDEVKDTALYNDLHYYWYGESV